MMQQAVEPSHDASGVGENLVPFFKGTILSENYWLVFVLCRSVARGSRTFELITVRLEISP
jgi:hypothetical protein